MYTRACDAGKTSPCTRSHVGIASTLIASAGMIIFFSSSFPLFPSLSFFWMRLFNFIIYVFLYIKVL
jgi:hypothetical protein